MACRGGLPGRCLTLAAAAACCLTPASACTVYDLFSSGLASSMWHMIPAVGLMADNGTFFVNNHYFPYKCSEDGGLHDWFENNATTKWTQEAEDADPGAPCRRLNSIYTMHAILKGANVQPDGYGDLAELAMPQVWKYKATVQATIDSVVAQLDLEEKPTIGFHIRGGDKLIEDKDGNRTTTLAHHYIEAFAEEKRRQAKKGQARMRGIMPNGTCVLVGDDEAFLREAQALAVERLGCKLFTKRESYEMSSHMQGLFNQLPYEQRCPASLHLLSDMELLGHTDYFVGSFTSGLTHLVEKMRYTLYGKHRRTTFDASSRKRDWYAQIRAYFDKVHPPFEYDFHKQRITRRRLFGF